jgi:hypothetical protein
VKREPVRPCPGPASIQSPRGCVRRRSLPAPRRDLPGRIVGYCNVAEAGLISDECTDWRCLSIARRLVRGAVPAACSLTITTSDNGEYVVPAAAASIMGAEAAMAKPLTWGAVVLVVVLALVALQVVVAEWTNDFWKAPLLKRTAQSPTGAGEASLVSDNSSFGGTSAWVVVSDPQRGATPVLVGGCYGSDGSVKLEHAVWSRDGTVLAVQAQVGNSSGKQFVGSVQRHFVAAYDYWQHQVLAGEEPTDALSKRIARLLARRGGKGQVVFRNPYDSSGKPIPSREAQLYARPLQ